MGACVAIHPPSSDAISRAACHSFFSCLWSENNIQESSKMKLINAPGTELTFLQSCKRNLSLNDGSGVNDLNSRV